MYRIRIFFVILLLAGCAGAAGPAGRKAQGQAFSLAYLSSITRHDGIDSREARLLAQSEMVFRGKADRYYVDEPFLEFVNKAYCGYRFYPINLNNQDARTNPSVLVVVSLDNGSVHYHDDGLTYIFFEQYTTGQ